MWESNGQGFWAARRGGPIESSSTWTIAAAGKPFGSPEQALGAPGYVRRATHMSDSTRASGLGFSLQRGEKLR